MSKHVDIGLSTRVDASPPDPDNPRTYSDDAFPAVIEDQRHAYKVETLAEVEAWQRAFLAGECPPHPVPRPLIAEIVRDNRMVTPRINASRWIGDCPECASANAVWDRNPSMVCLGCGRSYKVAWQSPKERSKVIRLIAEWPTMHRSWDAHTGETYEELVLDHARNMGDVELRNGLIVAAGIKMPDDLTSPGEYLDRIRTRRLKAVEA